MSSTKKLGLAFAAIVVTASILWFARRAHETRAQATAAAATAPAPPSAGMPAAPRSRVRRLAPEDRTRLAEAIRQAQLHDHDELVASPTTAGTTARPSLPDDPLIEKEYIRASVHDLIPLLADCYNQGVERNPALAGDVVVDFTIEGEPGVGGVISESSIDAATSTLDDATTRECIQETMYAIEIDPPADGGVIKVRYPFTFRTAPAH